VLIIIIIPYNNKQKRGGEVKQMLPPHPQSDSRVEYDNFYDAIALPLVKPLEKPRNFKEVMAVFMVYLYRFSGNPTTKTGFFFNRGTAGRIILGILLTWTWLDIKEDLARSFDIMALMKQPPPRE
jgi:hypothetical protein